MVTTNNSEATHEQTEAVRAYLADHHPGAVITGRRPRPVVVFPEAPAGCTIPVGVVALWLAVYREPAQIAAAIAETLETHSSKEPRPARRKAQ